jgi:phenylalanyl-tRNA synthetase alpha chain
MSGVSAPTPTAPTRAELEELVTSAAARLASCASLEELEAVTAELIGRQSAISAFKRALATVPPEERPALGEAINAARDAMDRSVRARRAELSHRAREARLVVDRMDLTEVLPGLLPGHLHVVTRVRDDLEDVFVGMGYEIAEGNEVESDWYNFTALNVPRDHPARSMQDSFYLALGDRQTLLLRTHTSPVQIHLLEQGRLPIYAVSPGRTYRRDTADASHLPVFHQIEGLVVDRGVTFGDLAGTIRTFVKAIFGASTRTRLRPAYFPFTEPSAEFEITCTICHGAGCRTCRQTGWLELGGCGMVHPAVLEATGVDPEEWSGFAFGFGIDRLALMRHSIEDLRSFVENDVRFLAGV